jgi:hypothetical protein
MRARVVTAAIRAADYIVEMSFLCGSVTTAHVKRSTSTINHMVDVDGVRYQKAGGLLV